MEGVNLDSLIEDLGCGPFQVIVALVVCLASIPSTWAIYFMTFGLYNPGWKCLDNGTITPVNLSANSVSNETQEHYYYDTTTEACDVFESCQNVVFNPAASTVATEFGLICGRSWVTSLMISLNMVGNVVTYALVGIAGDKFGRKVTIQVSMVFQMIFSVVSVFSTSWQMFAAVEFLIGSVTSFATLASVVTNEFVPRIWRMRVSSLPTWTVAVSLFSVLAMITRDWKILRLIASGLLGISFLLLFWIPKTPRFLSAKGKRKQLFGVMKRIAKYNKTDTPDQSSIDLVIHTKSEEKRPSPILSLFKKGYKLNTFVIGISFVIADMTYFAMTFGTSSLPGDMYENMLILTISELPGNAFAGVVGNLAGRRISILIFTILGSLCLFGVSAFDLLSLGGSRTIGTLVLLVVAKIFLNAGWYVLSTATLEMYPTVARSTVNSYARMASTIGGVMAPYLVPSDPTSFYISFLVMGGLMFLIGFLALLLPETKGKALHNEWGDIEREERCERARKQSLVINAVV